MLTQHLTEVDHHRTAIDESRHRHSGDPLGTGADNEVTRKPLLIVILHKVEHPTRQSLLRLPDGGDIGSGSLSSQHADQSVVEPHLVVEVVQPGIQILPIAPRLVDLSDEEELRKVGMEPPDHPVPEGYRYHLRHVTPEAVHPLHRPVVEDVVHLVPGVRHRLIEVSHPGIGIDAVIELHRIVPVVSRGMGVEDVIARRPSGIL